MSYIFTVAGSLQHGDGSTITDGIFLISTPASPIVSLDGSPVFSGPIQFQFAFGSSAPTFVDFSIVTPQPVTINPTAIKGQVDGKFVIRDGDGVVMNCTGTLTAGGSGNISGPVVCVAAQDKVSAL
jgi:hypothetical protein